MAKQLIKVNRKKLFSALDYISEINNTDSLLNLDFTDLIGRDLTIEEKKQYIKSYPKKDNLYIVNLIFGDYFESRI